MALGGQRYAGRSSEGQKILHRTVHQAGAGEGEEERVVCMTELAAGFSDNIKNALAVLPESPAFT